MEVNIRVKYGDQYSYITEERQEKNILKILQEKICTISKINNVIRLNQIIISVNAQQEFKKLLHQKAKNIANKLQDDRKQLRIYYNNLQSCFNFKKQYQITGKEEINIFLESVRLKYLAILLDFSDLDKKDFRQTFVSPLHLQIDHQSELYIDSMIEMDMNVCGQDGCFVFQDRLQPLFSEEIGPKIVLQKFYLFIRLNQYACADSENACIQYYGNQQQNIVLDFKEVMLLGKFCQTLNLEANKKKEVIKLGPSVKKLCLNGSAMRDIKLDILSKNLQTIQISHFIFQDIVQYLNQLDRQNIVIGEIVIIFDFYWKFSLELVKRLLDCRFLLRFAGCQEFHGNQPKKNDKKKNQNGKHYKQEIDLSVDKIDRDIQIFEKLQIDQDNSQLNYHLRIFDGLYQENFKEEKFNELKQIPLPIVTVLQENCIEILNQKFSSCLSCICTYKLFHRDFSIFRLLYDLQEN